MAPKLTDGMWQVVQALSDLPLKLVISQFGKISKPASALSFGLSSLFSKKTPKSEASLSRASSSANMFSALSTAGSDGLRPTEPAVARGAGSRKPSVDLGPSGAPALKGGSVRKRLNLLPRSKPTDAEAEVEKEEEAEATLESVVMSETDAQKKIKEDVKVCLSIPQKILVPNFARRST